MLRLDGVRNDLCSTHAIDAIRLDNVRPARRRQMARRGEEEEGRLPSAPRLVPVNLFSRFQVDSPWRIMTTVLFRRAPERRARWVARSNIATTLELLGLRLLRALAGTGSCGQCARDAAFSRINSLITRVRDAAISP